MNNKVVAMIRLDRSGLLTMVEQIVAKNVERGIGYVPIEGDVTQQMCEWEFFREPFTLEIYTETYSESSARMWMGGISDYSVARSIRISEAEWQVKRLISIASDHQVSILIREADTDWKVKAIINNATDAQLKIIEESILDICSMNAIELAVIKSGRNALFNLADQIVAKNLERGRNYVINPNDDWIDWEYRRDLGHSAEGIATLVEATKYDSLAEMMRYTFEEWKLKVLVESASEIQVGTLIKEAHSEWQVKAILQYANEAQLKILVETINKILLGQYTSYRQDLSRRYADIFESNLHKSSVHKIGEIQDNNLTYVSMIRDKDILGEISELVQDLKQRFGVNARFQNEEAHSHHVTISSYNVSHFEPTRYEARLTSGTLQDVHSRMVGRLDEFKRGLFDNHLKNSHIKFIGVIPTKDSIILAGYYDGQMRQFREDLNYRVNGIDGFDRANERSIPSIVHLTICVFDENSTPLTPEQKTAIYEFYKNYDFGTLRVDNVQLLKVLEYAIYPGKENIVEEITF